MRFDCRDSRGMRERKKGAVPSAQVRLRKNVREKVVMQAGRVSTYRIGSKRQRKANETLRVKNIVSYALLTALDNVGSTMATAR